MIDYDKWKLETPDYLETDDDEDEDDLDLDEPSELDLWEDEEPDCPVLYSLADIKRWVKANLSLFEHFSHEIHTFNKYDIDGEKEGGEWWYADEKNLVIYSGTYGGREKIGSPYCTYGEVFDNSEDFNDTLEMYEQMKEWNDDDDLDSESLD